MKREKGSALSHMGVLEGNDRSMLAMGSQRIRHDFFHCIGLIVIEDVGHGSVGITDGCYCVVSADSFHAP